MMPVVHVRGLVDSDEASIDAALIRVADSISAAASCPVEDVWCTFTTVSAMTLGRAPATPDNKILFVDLHMRSRGTDTNAAALQEAAFAAAAAFDVPVADVWASLVPVESGTVFAGGQPI
jgi:hypothetical protein